MNSCQLPPPLKSGDLLRVIAPSGALREFEAFHQGVEVWRSRGYRVDLSLSVDDCWGYLAGEDENRRRQLAVAWQDPECQGILCARGGYGSARLLEDWTWEKQSVPIAPKVNPKLIPNHAILGEESISPKIASKSKNQNPKWLIGFSDITGLLWSLSKEGISGVHGPVLTTLAAEPDWSVERLFDWVEGRSLPPLKGLGWGGGVVGGILLPANLTVATHFLNTPVQPQLDGVILALEDVTEAPYRIDRALTQWRLSGAFQKVRGIALGRFSRCEAPANIPSLTVQEVLRDRLANLGIPIVSDLPFGHDGANAALPVGIAAQLDADLGTLKITSRTSPIQGVVNKPEL